MVADEEVLAAVNAAGTELTMMPSGAEYQIEQTPVLEMVRTGHLTGLLRAVAMKVAGSEGLDTETLSDEESAAWDQLQREMICRWVRGFAWTCSCAGCTKRRGQAGLEPIELRPFKLTPEILAADPPKISRVDLVALNDMTLYVRTPAHVDAISRLAHGQMTAEETQRITQEEAFRTVSGWAPFRRKQGGGGVGGDSQVLGDDALAPAGYNRAARRHPPRSGSRRSAGRRARARK